MRTKLFILGSLSALSLVLGLGACKKDSGSGSGSGQNSVPAPAPTSGLVISPPQADVGFSQPTTLSATLDGSPVAVDWSVSNSSMGTVSPTHGTQCVFTPKTAGHADITASVNGQTATCHLVILQPGQTPTPTPVPSGTPTATPTPVPTFPQNLNLYNDQGGILGNPNVLLFTGGGLTIDEKSGGAAEGSKYLESVTPTGGFWGISLDKNNQGLSANASSLAGGALRFSIRLARNLNTAEVLHINLSDKSQKTFSVSVGKDPSCSGDVSGQWQELVIPISLYPGVDLSHLTVPFAIADASPSGSPRLTFDIDNVRWTTSTAGAAAVSASGVAALVCP
jgi:hypothetical protein